MAADARGKDPMGHAGEPLIGPRTPQRVLLVAAAARSDTSIIVLVSVARGRIVILGTDSSQTHCWRAATLASWRSSHGVLAIQFEEECLA